MASPFCPSSLLRDAIDALRARTGWARRVGVEQEFHVFGADLPSTQALSVAALRRADPFAPCVIAALEEAGVEPDVVLAEFGPDPFEVTCAPADPITAADRAIAIRENVREIPRVRARQASIPPTIERASGREKGCQVD